jgi:glutamate-1-semialdehyde 2,1-aminomutase
MAAALACLKELKHIEAPKLILQTGKKVTDGLVEIAGKHGLELKVTGMLSMPYLRTEHESGIEFHQSLCGECTRRGVFMASHHNLFISAAHSQADVQRTFDIFEDAVCSTKERNR